MKIHWLQHVPFEGLGSIESWAAAHGAELRCTRLFAGGTLPDAENFDLLIVMGGPMGIHDELEYPWLAAEKILIRSAIDRGCRVLGICLGAQLIADVLGARVYPGPHREIGWMPVQRAAGAPGWMPEETVAFHWHGDTFDLPQGSVRLASSPACPNQGFTFGNHVTALQFHLETTPESMELLIAHCAGELPEGPYIQTAQEMRDQSGHFGAAHKVMADVLDRLMEVR
jgi:GMP synthase-like glutamine amidotransferase